MITLGGLPLLIPDSDGELLRWQEAFQNSEYYNDFCEPSFRDSSRYATMYSSGKDELPYGVGIPIPPYTAAPAPRINQLYWPTGAGRWSRGYFMANTATKDRIYSFSRFGTPLTLEIKNTDSLVIFTREIFTKNQVTEMEFLQSLEWYKSKPELLDSMYQNILSEIAILHSKKVK